MNFRLKFWHHHSIPWSRFPYRARYFGDTRTFSVDCNGTCTGTNCLNLFRTAWKLPKTAIWSQICVARVYPWYTVPCQISFWSVHTVAHATVCSTASMQSPSSILSMVIEEVCTIFASQGNAEILWIWANFKILGLLYPPFNPLWPNLAYESRPGTRSYGVHFHCKLY